MLGESRNNYRGEKGIRRRPLLDGPGRFIRTLVLKVIRKRTRLKVSQLVIGILMQGSSRLLTDRDASVTGSVRHKNRIR